MRYTVSRSGNDKAVHVICEDGAFYTKVPDCVRHLGPWQGLSGGEIARLKPHYRLMLAEQGFVLVYLPIGVFRAEVP